TLAALGRVAGGIAHEINNPLGVILGHARLIERGGGAATEDAAAIARETRACKGIVEALLDYARPGLLKRAPVDLAALAWEVVDRHAGATLEAGGEVVVPGDARRLGQVLDNLVRNGLAFGAAVTVEVAAADGGARLVVRDDGPGVAAEDVERVFEPFFSTRADGTGLGLAIAHSVVLAHGGAIAARPGPGGHFTLFLPGEEAYGPHPGD
ncbi:MAG: HAMP domain-containing histidine kinase, partial [Myxococcales bacterium]|nr:HAMP domain-containing histidine kinase [Myxococcales bacterium]